MSSQVKTLLIVIGVIVAVGLAFWSYKRSAGPSINLTPEQIMKQLTPSNGAAPPPARP